MNEEMKYALSMLCKAGAIVLVAIAHNLTQELTAK